MGPQPSSGQTLVPRATKEQIVDFFLTTYQSFVHPTILMRLLLHRLSSRVPGTPFDWSILPDKSTVSPASHAFSIPTTETNVLHLIARWLEGFPADFLEHPQLQEGVTKVIQRMKLAWGPYIPHTHRLRSLLNDVGRPRMDSSGTGADNGERTPHHDNLYSLVRTCVCVCACVRVCARVLGCLVV